MSISEHFVVSHNELINSHKELLASHNVLIDIHKNFLPSKNNTQVLKNTIYYNLLVL